MAVCALGVVATCAGVKDEHGLTRREKRTVSEDHKPLLRAMQERWPEITEMDAAHLECAFEGWDEGAFGRSYLADRLSYGGRPYGKVDRENEF